MNTEEVIFELFAGEPISENVVLSSDAFLRFANKLQKRQSIAFFDWFFEQDKFRLDSMPTEELYEEFLKSKQP